jgi:predicted DNA-binding transcriptional regulator AlpA
MTKETPLVLSPKQTAVMLDISERTLWRLRSSGKIPEPVRFGGSTRWKYEDIKNWLDAGCPTQGQ